MLRFMEALLLNSILATAPVRGEEARLPLSILFWMTRLCSRDRVNFDVVRESDLLCCVTEGCDSRLPKLGSGDWESRFHSNPSKLRESSYRRDSLLPLTSSEFFLLEWLLSREVRGESTSMITLRMEHSIRVVKSHSLARRLVHFGPTSLLKSS